MLFFLTCVLILQYCSPKELPSFIHVCHKNDPKMFECIVQVAEELKPHLAKGVPEYRIPNIEPLVLDELISEESAGLRVETDNVKAYGCSNYVIKSLNINFDEQIYEIDMELPLLNIEAHYNISGTLVMMPIKGEGPLKANVTNCKSKTLLKGELYEKDGNTYLRYTEMTLNVQVGSGEVKVENLFNGDKFLNDMINESVNKNLDVFLVEAMPIIERALAAAFLNIANRIVEPYTYEQLFPY